MLGNPLSLPDRPETTEVSIADVLQQINSLSEFNFAPTQYPGCTEQQSRFLDALANTMEEAKAFEIAGVSPILARRYWFDETQPANIPFLSYYDAAVDFIQQATLDAVRTVARRGRTTVSVDRYGTIKATSVPDTSALDFIRAHDLPSSSEPQPSSRLRKVQATVVPAIVEMT